MVRLDRVPPRLRFVEELVKESLSERELADHEGRVGVLGLAQGLVAHGQTVTEVDKYLKLIGLLLDATDELLHCAVKLDSLQCTVILAKSAKGWGKVIADVVFCVDFLLRPILGEGLWTDNHVKFLKQVLG